MRSIDRVSGPTSWSRTALVLSLAVALLFGLAACSDSREEEEDKVTPTAETTDADAVDASGKPAGPAVAAVRPRVPEAPMAKSAASGRIETALFGPQRTAEERTRDPYRHPMETLTFFGLTRNMRVVEISPGTGWYSAIIAPVVKSFGRYVAAIPDEKLPNQPAYYATLNKQLTDRFSADHRTYGLPLPIVRYNADQPTFGPPASADMVLSFRNAHNWIADGTAEAYFQGFFAVLKPGGTLGIVDHRAAPGTVSDGSTGYVTEQQVIDLATGAGFRLAGRSEINANPKDTKDHPEGVWTLPPTYALKDVDREKYRAIGESDRMTLKFVKP